MIGFPDLLKEITRKRKKRYLPFDEARGYGFDLDPDWGIDISFPEGKDGDEPKVSLVSPDKWLFKNLVYDEFDDLTDYEAVSPEGKSYYKADLEGQPRIPQPQVPKEPTETDIFQTFKKAFPYTISEDTIGDTVDYYSQNLAKLRRDLIKAGKKDSTTALVQMLYPAISQKGIEDYFKEDIVPPAVLPEAEGLPTSTWLDRVKEIKADPASIVPFVSSGKEIITLAMLMKTALDLEQNREVSQEDLLALKAYVDQATKNTSWGYEVTDVLAQLIPFAGEFILTGGIFALGKTAVVKAGQQALKRIATRTGLRILEGKLARFGVEVAGVIAGGTLRTIPAGATRIPAATLEKQLTAKLTGDEETIWRSAFKALGEQWVEVVSEQTGGLFKPLTNAAKGQMIKSGLFKAFQKANPGKNAGDLTRVMDKLGYHGVLEEMLEERVADVGHGILETLGLSDQEFKLPSARQLSVELVAFTIPGAAARIAGGIPAGIEEAKLAPERGAFGGVPGKRVVPIKSSTDPSKWVLYDKVEQITYGNKRDTYEEALKAAETENAKLALRPVTPEVTYTVADMGPTTRAGKPVTRWEILTKGKPSGRWFTTKAEAEAFANKIEARLAETLKPELAIPKAEPGMPEAGLQPEMFGAPPVEVRPAGKGKITQISMEEQLKLEQARRAAEEAPEEVREAYEAQAEIEGLKEYLQTDPVASLRFKIGNRSYSIDNIVDAKEKTFAYNDSFTLSQAKAIRPNVVFSEANKLPNGRIRADAVLDELATKYTGGDVNAFIDKVNQIRREKVRIAEAGLPYLSVPEETTLPMPDKVKASEDRIVMPPPPPKEPPPPEPPPTHPPQPAPIEQGRITMPDLQAPQLVVDMYSKPDFWRRVANLPLVRKAVGLFNPAAVADNPAQQAIILRAALKDEGAQKAQAVMSHLWEIGTQERIWGKTDEMGLLTKEPFVGISIDDIRQNPAKFSAQMTEKQREWIKRASEVEKAKLDALKRNEIEINELSFEDGGQYAGRRVMGKFNDTGELIESGRIGVGGRVGAKQAFEKTRIFKEASDGIAAGYRYMNSDEALYYNTLGAYYKIADKQMADWILSKVDWRTTKAPEALVLQAESAHLRLRKAQQLLGVLNRAVRGERVPGNTINSIGLAFGDQADTLRTLIPELQKPSPETADTVRILTAEAKALISEARLEYYQAVNERARAREEAMRVKYEEASIAHPAFAGKIFTGKEAKEIADILNRGLSPQFIEALGAVNKVNAIGRFFMLAGDVSPMTIQLQFLAFYRPKAYAKAMGGFVRAMFDPEFQYRYYANNRDLINRHPTLILSGRGTEFTEFMGRGGLGKKLGVLAKPLVPFQKAFEGSLDVAGIELAKSLDHLATTPERTLEVDQFINEFRGLTSSARIGVSSIQRQGETGLLLAPRYNRAIAGILFDIVHGGIRGHQARMSLAQGLAGISAMAVAISIALGEDEDEIWEHFNNESPTFYTWDFFGIKVGLGGKVRSILKTFGNMTRTGEVGQPALNFLRGSLSPGASTGFDLLTGKNYIGEPTRDNILDFTKTVGRNFMMIWTQSFLMEGGTLKDKAIIATAEFFGLRGYDISARKEMKIQELEELLGQQVGKTPILTTKKPDIYDMKNIYSDIKRLLQFIRPEEVLADKGYAPLGHAVVRYEQSEALTLPDIAFKSYNFEKAKGDTLADFMKQWSEREKIITDGERAIYTRVKMVEGKEQKTVFKGLAALNAHKTDYPKAQLGNITRRQRELLLQYNAATDKEMFIKDNPDIETNLKIGWLKSHPRENAEYAVLGQEKIYSKEANNQFQKLIKEWDIIDSAIPGMTLPPEGSIDTHFTYQDMVAGGKQSSWEAQLLLKENALKAKEAKTESYVDWAGLKLSDTPITSLRIKTKPEFRRIYDKIQSLGDKASPDYIADEKTRAEAMKNLKTPEYIDNTRRIEAIEKGTDDNPISDALVKSHMEYGQIQDKEGVGSSSAESMLYRVDNPEYDQFRTDETLWGNNALKLIDTTRIPIWRIDVKYTKEDTAYDTLPTTGTARADYLKANAEYATARIQRTGYELGFKDVTKWTAYNQLPEYGFWRERYRMTNPDFDTEAKGLSFRSGRKPWADIDPTKIPAQAYDEIYEKYKDLFTQFENAKGDARENIFAENPAFKEAYYRRAGYGLLLPAIYIDNYVTYMLLPKKGYADSRFLKTHQDFYWEMKRKLGWKEDIDFDKIPSEEVETLYNLYREAQEQKVGQEALDNFRAAHLDLDDWLFRMGKVSSRITEKVRRKGMTPRERFEYETTKLDIEFDKRLEELRQRIESLARK